MRQALRSLLPMAAVALLLTAALDLWIRVRPVDMPASLQITLGVALLVALAALIGAVRWEERTDPTGGVDVGTGEPSQAP